MYLDIGKAIFSDLLLRARVECGIAGIRDLRNNAREDRMESFVLSETLKVCKQPSIRYLIVYSKHPVSLFAIRRREPIAQRRLELCLFDRGTYTVIRTEVFEAPFSHGAAAASCREPTMPCL